MRRDLLQQLLRERAAKQPVAVITDLASGAQWLIRSRDGEAPPGLGAEILEETRRALRADRAGVVSLDGRSLFINVYNPPLRMILVGAVHIAQPLARMAALSGFEVWIVDPRAAFAAADRFPGLRISTAWPDRGVAELAPDARTAIVTLTHDPKLDDPALCQALRSDAFYIGSLGSRKTHRARRQRLQGEGFDEEAIGRIHGPVGLAIGARSPAEISVSILAQVIASLRAATP